MVELNDFIEIEEEEEQKKGEKPEYRVVQTDRNQDGSQKFVEVGAMWRNTSKAGRTFYTLKIGKLRLLVFPNERK